MLEVKNLYKMYKGTSFYSLENISFSVSDGEIVGLVGSNGAGKSTLIKSITGIIPFDRGTISVNGINLQKNPVKAKKIIGYVPDDHLVYDKLTGREYVNYMGSVFGVSKKDKQTIANSLAKELYIDHALDRQIGSYSHGMKQKICLLGSLIHNPKLWILDEPTVGLDPQTIEVLMSIIQRHATEGNSVLFSSHNLDVVKKLCDKVIFIVKGKIVSILDKDYIDIRHVNFDLYFKKLNGIKDE